MSELDTKALNELTTHPLLSTDEQLSLVRKVKFGTPEEAKEARDRLIVENMRLVVSSVRLFCSDAKDPRFTDLVNAGIVGYLIGIDKFEIDRGHALSTYVVWWIRAKIREELKRHGTRVVKNKSLQDAYVKSRNRLTKELGYTPNDEDVFQDLEWDADRIRQFQSSSDLQMIPIDQLDAATLHDQASSLVCNDDDEDHVLEKMLNSEQVANLYGALQDLDPITREVLQRHYGMGYPSQTYDVIAVEMGLTRERVRALENSGLRTLYLSFTEDDTD